MKKLYLIIAPDDKTALYRATQQEIHESDFPAKKIFEIEANPANSIKYRGEQTNYRPWRNHSPRIGRWWLQAYGGKASMTLEEMFDKYEDEYLKFDDEVWLAWGSEDLEKLTEEDVLYITRCGVRYDSGIESLAMFV